MDIELKMPDLATTGSAMRVVRWLVEVGQHVNRGDPILEIETDKATMELEAVASGRLKEMHLRPNDEVSVGQIVAMLESEDGGPAAVRDTRSSSDAKPASMGGMFAKNRAASRSPVSDPVEQAIALSPVQRAVARRMVESKQSAPHFYLQTSANAEPIVARRAATAAAWDAFFVHAAAKALARFDRMRYRYDSDRLRPSESDAIGVAVDHEGELFVIPVVAPAGKSPEAISGEIRSAVEKVRSGDPDARRLNPTNLTVTNLGSTGVETFTAIVNPPEASILAIGKVAAVAAVESGKVIAQHRVSLTLSVDHRVVSGKYAAEFLQSIVQELESL